MTGIDTRALRDAFGAFMTGVTVVTTTDEAGAPVGFTANSFASVSLDPPLLLVCPGKFLNSFDIFSSCKNFAVNVLAEGQENVANTFASYKGDRFLQVAWSADPDGAPLLAGAAAQFSCRTEQVIPAGDHVVLMGRVTAFRAAGRPGLGYAAGRYFSLGLEREAAAPHADQRNHAGVIIEYAGGIILSETAKGLAPPVVALPRDKGTREAVAGWLAHAGLDVTLGHAYSIFDDRRDGRHYIYFNATAWTAATGSLGRYVPVADLRGARLAGGGVETMLRRYAAEYDTGGFSLYVGDDSSGDLIDTPNARSRDKP